MIELGGKLAKCIRQRRAFSDGQFCLPENLLGHMAVLVGTVAKSWNLRGCGIISPACVRSHDALGNHLEVTSSCQDLGQFKPARTTMYSFRGPPSCAKEWHPHATSARCWVPNLVAPNCCRHGRSWSLTSSDANQLEISVVTLSALTRGESDDKLRHAQNIEPLRRTRYFSRISMLLKLFKTGGIPLTPPHVYQLFSLVGNCWPNLPSFRWTPLFFIFFQKQANCEHFRALQALMRQAARLGRHFQHLHGRRHGDFKADRWSVVHCEMTMPSDAFS